MVAFFNTKKNFHDDVRGKPDQIRDEFDESPEMSTYLVAFVVCDFDIVSKVHIVNSNENKKNLEKTLENIITKY